MTALEIIRITQIKKLTADLQEYYDELDERIIAKENDVRILLIRLLSLNNSVLHKTITPPPVSDTDNRVNSEKGENSTNDKEYREVNQSKNKTVSLIQEKRENSIQYYRNEVDSHGDDDSVVCNVTKEQSIIVPSTIKTKNVNSHKINNVMSKSPIIVKSHCLSESRSSPVQPLRHCSSNTVLHNTNGKENRENRSLTQEDHSKDIFDKNRNCDNVNSIVYREREMETFLLPQIERPGAKRKTKRVRFSSKSPRVSTYSCERAPTVSPIYSTVKHNKNINWNTAKNSENKIKNNNNNNENKYSTSYANTNITSTTNDTNCSAAVDCNWERNYIVYEPQKDKNCLETENSFNSVRELITSAREASPRSSVDVYLNCVAQMRNSLELHNEKRSKYDKQTINWQQEGLPRCELYPNVDQEMDAGAPTMSSSLSASKLLTQESALVNRTESIQEKYNNHDVKRILLAKTSDAPLQSCLADNTKSEEFIKCINNLTARNAHNAVELEFTGQRCLNANDINESANNKYEQKLSKEELEEISHKPQINTVKGEFIDSVDYRNKENFRQCKNKNKYEDVHDTDNINEQFTAPALWVQRRRCRSAISVTPSPTVHRMHQNKLKRNTFGTKTEWREKCKQRSCNNKTSNVGMTIDHPVQLPQSEAEATEEAAATVKIEKLHKLFAHKKSTQSNRVLNVHHNIELACGPTLYFD